MEELYLRREFRTNKDVEDMLNDLCKDKSRYESKSHAIRCAIVKLYNGEKK